MAINVNNLDREQKENPPLGEALQKVQNYINANVAVTPGNKIPVPTFVKPGNVNG